MYHKHKKRRNIQLQNKVISSYLDIIKIHINLINSQTRLIERRSNEVVSYEKILYGFLLVPSPVTLVEDLREIYERTPKELFTKLPIK